jgi:hypothetical protein
MEKYMSKKATDGSIPESAKDVAEARRGFHEASLNYCSSLNQLKMKRRVEIMCPVLNFFSVTLNFYQQCNDELRRTQPSIVTLADTVHKLRQDSSATCKNNDRMKLKLFENQANAYNPVSKGLIDNIKLIQPHSPQREGEPIEHVETNTMREIIAPVVKAGYLFKKSQQQRVRQSWSRRYFAIRGELLTYAQRGKDEEPVVALNLRT